MTDVTSALRAASGTMPDGRSALLNVRWMRAAADEIDMLRRRLAQAERALDCSDGYARGARHKDEILPTVWELQNGHVRDALNGVAT